jgi:hypothetical protein
MVNQSTNRGRYAQWGYALCAVVALQIRSFKIYTSCKLSSPNGLDKRAITTYTLPDNTAYRAGHC